MPPIARPAAPPSENRILYEIISTVGSSLELEQVLAAVVRLLSDASAVHACFVYLVEDGGERLVLARGVGSVRPSRRRDRARARRRARVVGRRAQGAGVHAGDSLRPAHEVRAGARGGEVPVASFGTDHRARRERDRRHLPPHRGAPGVHRPEVEVLASSASLVAGAIENARLYEETRQRVGELEHLAELAETLTRAQSLEELLPAVAARASGSSARGVLPRIPPRPRLGGAASASLGACGR